jgi:tRNA dimethylallyltransferase
MTNSLPLMVAILGPTASGKTALALEIAKEIPCEIISMDSALVYKDMDIGTAKPSQAERAAVPHHLIDIIDPTESYSAAHFCKEVIKLNLDIIHRNKLPLLVGGTMMYFNALTQGLDDLPTANINIRQEIEAEIEKMGLHYMHAQLEKLDPHSAARIKPNDSQRISRALEIIRLTGKPMSELLATRAKPTLPFQLLSFALEPTNRAQLHERIAARFDLMLKENERNIIQELQDLRSRYLLHANLPSMRAVGYRQTWEYLEGHYDKTTLREKGIIATRQLAKRQLTWLRAMPERIVLDCFGQNNLKTILHEIKLKLI